MEPVWRDDDYEWTEEDEDGYDMGHWPCGCCTCCGCTCDEFEDDEGEEL